MQEVLYISLLLSSAEEVLNVILLPIFCRNIEYIYIIYIYKTLVARVILAASFLFHSVGFLNEVVVIAKNCHLNNRILSVLHFSVV